MIRTSGKDILRFLTIHYEFVQSAFQLSVPEFLLDSEKLNSLISEYNLSAESKLSVEKLVEVKFGKELTTGDFKLNTYYTDFLQFIFRSFILDLPETLETRYQTVYNHFNRLKTENNFNKVVLLIKEIIKEVDNFLIDIESETARLLEDTESLKVNAENNSEYTTRLQKANYWIDEYIIPLNAILDKDHPNSIVNTIIQIQRYASEKRFIENDYHLRREFEKLYNSSVHARNELDGNLTKLTRELLPLLDRIKSDSIILSGFYHFIENVDYADQYIIPLPNLIRKTVPTVYSRSFESEALFYLDQFEYQVKEIIYSEEVSDIDWLPDSSYFKDLLLKEKVIPNFYKWCFDRLIEHTSNISLSSYFNVTNLILEEDLVAEYQNDSRFEVQLQDAVLQLPVVKVYEKLSN